MNKARIITVMTCFAALFLTTGIASSADFYGNFGINNFLAKYAADVVSPDGASKSQLHFSLTGEDTGGGYLTSVADNNFWVSSGAAYDADAGGWIQKASEGSSVLFGSGTAGFRIYLQEGNSVGAPLSNIVQALKIDYSGNLDISVGDIKIPKQSGPGRAYACFEENGTIVRSLTPCL